MVLSHGLERAFQPALIPSSRSVDTTGTAADGGEGWIGKGSPVAQATAIGISVVPTNTTARTGPGVIQNDEGTSKQRNVLIVMSTKSTSFRWATVLNVFVKTLVHFYYASFHVFIWGLYKIRFFKMYTLEVFFFILKSLKIINIKMYNVLNSTLFLWWQSWIFSSLYSSLQSQMILIRWFGSQ